MKRTILTIVGAVALAMSLPGLASDQPQSEDVKVDAVIGGGENERPDVLYGEVVNDIYAPRVSSFRAIDNQRVLIYTTPFKPYLLTLDRRSSGLVFEDRLALKYNNSRIYTKFDSVVVDGIPYFIKRIEKLDRKTAKSLTRKDFRKDDRETAEDEADNDNQTESDSA